MKSNGMEGIGLVRVGLEGERRVKKIGREESQGKKTSMDGLEGKKFGDWW